MASASARVARAGRVRSVLAVGHPALQRRSEGVQDVRAPSFRRLVRDLVATMDAHDADGLSAVQLGAHLRAFAVRDLHNALPEDLEGLDQVQVARQRGIRPTVVVNPVILSRSAEHVCDWEGCLSFPDMVGKVCRPRCVEVEYTQVDGTTVRASLDGWGARVFQHEFEHLEGGLFLEALENGIRSLVHASELHHHLDDATPEPGD